MSPTGSVDTFKRAKRIAIAAGDRDWETNLEGFTRIIDLVKSYFKTVLLISHMDSLKDIVDVTINIEKVKGYARVNQ